MYGISLPHMSWLEACALLPIHGIRYGTSLCRCEVHVGKSVCAERAVARVMALVCYPNMTQDVEEEYRIVSDDDSNTGNKVWASDVCKSPHTCMLRVRNANKVSHLSLMLQQSVV